MQFGRSHVVQNRNFHRKKIAYSEISGGAVSNKVVGSLPDERPFCVEVVCSTHGSFSRSSGSIPQTKHTHRRLKCVFPLLG